MTITKLKKILHREEKALLEHRDWAMSTKGDKVEAGYLDFIDGEISQTRHILKVITDKLYAEL